MQGINKFIGLGTLGQDVQTYKTRNNRTFARVSLAINERIKVGDNWQDYTEWITVIAWGHLANALAKYAQKGSNIYVEGQLRTRKWEDKEGITRWTTEVVAQEVRFLSSPSEQKEEPPQKEDDVPF